MKKLFTAVLVLFSFMAVTPAIADDEKEAVALVKKAVAYMKANGREKALAAFNDIDGQFFLKDKGLYIIAADEKGFSWASGANPALRDGKKNLWELKDSDNVFIVQGMWKVAREKGSGFVYYKWPNPINNKIQPKATYVELVGDLVIGCGYYRDQK